MSNRVLICIDCQVDFITGVLGSAAADAAVPKVRALIDEFMQNGEKIIFTMDTHYPNYLNSYEGKKLPVEHCIYSTKGWELDNRIDVTHFYENMLLIQKPTFGYMGWYNCDLDQYDEIVICGFCSSICCMANTQIIHALYPETRITFVENASAGLSEEDHNAAITIMKDCQIDVVNLDVE